MTDLVGFLLARIAEDEAAGERAVVWRTPQGWAWIGPTPETATALAVSGHRVLAECEAKRSIIAEHEDGEHCRTTSTLDDLSSYPSPCVTLRLLALPYADHADYQETWRP